MVGRNSKQGHEAIAELLVVLDTYFCSNEIGVLLYEYQNQLFKLVDLNKTFAIFVQSFPSLLVNHEIKFSDGQVGCLTAVTHSLQNDGDKQVKEDEGHDHGEGDKVDVGGKGVTAAIWHSAASHDFFVRWLNVACKVYARGTSAVHHELVPGLTCTHSHK